jgi:tyrosinase
MFRTFTTALCLLVAVTGLVAAIQYPSYDFGGVDFEPELDKRQVSGIIGIGRLGNEGDPPRIRQEIRELKQDFYKWNLFILALSILQTADPGRQDSWYQICGRFLIFVVFN